MILSSVSKSKLQHNWQRLQLTDDKEESFEAEKVARVDGGGVSGIAERVAHLPSGESKGRQPKKA